MNARQHYMNWREVREWVWVAKLAALLLGVVLGAGWVVAHAQTLPEGAPKQVAAGAFHTCALLRDGTVRCWGGNFYGQLGDGTANNRSSTPVTVVVAGSAPLSNVEVVAPGLYHTCASLEDGTVRCWGANYYGQLGDGTTTDRTTPVQVSGLSNVVQVAAGRAHTCAVLGDGTVRCWGRNDYGQLGDGTTTISRITPVTVVVASGAPLSNVVAVAAGENHTCAVLRDGTVRCWGLNDYGQLGDGTTTISRTMPVTVVVASGAPLSNVVAVAAGRYHTCAVLRDGTVRCWGYNYYGQLGDGTTISRTTPVTVVGLSNVAGVAAGWYHTCAVLRDGTVQCWGWNDYGQLGDGTTISRTTPVTVVGLSNVAGVAAGWFHTCAVLRDGTVRCWGANSDGQLGDGTRTNRSTPVRVSGLSNGVAVAAGWSHTCAVLRDGTVQCWGWNDYGQLGDGTTTVRTTPVQVSGLSNGVAVATGVSHTCALLNDGTVRCWGANFYGQLGDGTTTNRSTPVRVSGLSNGVSVAAGDYHTCAVLGDGTVRCWGYNYYGQLGDGTTISRTTPVTVVVTPGGVPLSNVVAVAAGWSHTCALLGDGTMRCWGANWAGQLGDGTTVNRSTPVTVVVAPGGPPLSTVVAVAAGWSHTCAVLRDGTVRCWGWNGYGQLGDGTTVNRSTPVTVVVAPGGAPLSNVVAVATGVRHTCALLNDGTVRCWGWNDYGQLGDGTTTISRTTPVTVVVAGGAPLSDVVAVAAGQAHTCAVLGDGTVRCWGWSFLGRLGNGEGETRQVADREVLLPFKVSPAPRAIIPTLNVTLRWRGGLGSASYYRYCVERGADCTPVTRVSAPTQSVSVSLPSGGVYSWAVEACTSDDVCVRADSRSFTFEVAERQQIYLPIVQRP